MWNLNALSVKRYLDNFKKDNTVKGKIFTFICGTLLNASPTLSHHNFAAHYQVDEIIEVSGVVTEFRFVNPHVRLYFEVRNEDGVLETWMAEGDASVALRRSGWTEDQLKAGDRVRIVGSPSRNGSNMLGWETITLANGTRIGGGSGRLEERLRILDQSLAQFRQQRSP